MRWALGAALLAAAALSVTLYWQLHGLSYGGAIRPTLAPGEFDLLLTARALASGQFLPLWAGSVHPDAIGTYLAAIEVALPLRAGLSDLAALKLCGVAHFALLCGSTTGLCMRVGGRRAATVTLAFLLLGAPAMLGAHSRFLGTTTEVIGLQVVALWWLIELVRRQPSRASVFACGLLLGTALVYSSHTLWLVLFGLLYWSCEAHRATWRQGFALLLGGILLASLPWKAASSAPGLETRWLTLKSMPVASILAATGVDDLVSLARHLPFTLLDTTGAMPADTPLRWLHLAWMAALCAALAWTLVARGRATLVAQRRPVDGLLAVYATVALAPMLFAGDLAGYPAAYRYAFNGVAVAAVLVGLRHADLWALLAARGGRPAARLLTAATGLAVVLGFGALPAAATLELTPPQAAFFAGHHRLFLVPGDPHRHVRLLQASVRAVETDAWLQGYGLFLGEEIGLQSAAPREAGDEEQESLRPKALVGLADTLTQPSHRRSFFAGVGLGLAADGRLDRTDIAVVDAVPPTQRGDLWFGLGAAVAERSYWSGSAAALEVAGGWQGLDGWPAQRAAFTRGYRSIEGARHEGPAQLLPAPHGVESAPAGGADPAAGDADPAAGGADPAAGDASLALAHPFLYNRIAQQARGEFK